MSQKYRILLLASGAGTIAQSIIDAAIEKRIDLDIVGLISDQNSPALARAKRSNIQNFYMPLIQPRQAWDDKLILQVNELNPDLVVSVGFMRILSQSFLIYLRYSQSLAKFLDQVYLVHDLFLGFGSIFYCYHCLPVQKVGLNLNHQDLGKLY